MLDAPSLDSIDLENFMVSKSSKAHENVALLESTTTYTILRDLGYFSFSSLTADAWQTCGIVTIAGSQDL